MNDRVPESAGARHGAAGQQLVATGIPNLDEILGGGLPQGSLVLVVGPPGSGKTTLATQITFGIAGGGRNALILTALSEPTNKLIAHLRNFSFYKDDIVGDALQVLSLEQFFPTTVETTVDALVNLVRSTQAGVVVIDGMQGMPGIENDTAAARSFLYQIGTRLGLLGTLTILTREAEPRDPSLFPEATTADVILGLHYKLDGVRARRGIEAVKVRGVAHLPGLHSLLIGSSGIEVYPRLEARVQRMLRSRVAAEPMSQSGALSALGQSEAFHTTLEGADHAQSAVTFGVTELDALLNGGLMPVTSTVIAGEAGTGKTSLALHFALEGVRRGEPVLWLSLRESHAQLMLKAALFAGDDLQRALSPEGGITLLEAPPVELIADVLGDQFLSTIEQIKAKRVVIDSLTELVNVIVGNGEGARVNEYLTALLVALRSRGITTLFLSETQSAPQGMSGNALGPGATVAENLLLMQQTSEEAQFRRTLSIRKLRFSRHDSAQHPFHIGHRGHGLQFEPPAQREGSIVSGEAASEAEGSSWPPH